MHEDQNPLRAMLRRLESRTTLSEDDRAALLDLPYSLRHFDPGRYMVRQGELPKFLGVLVNGYIYRQKLDSDGGRQILSIHVPGDILDLQHLHLDVADHNVQALTHCEIAVIPEKAFRDVAQRRPAINHAVFINALVEASMFREWMLNVGRRTSYGRVAHLLCEFAVRLDKTDEPEGQAYDLPMTQEQIADAIGATTVHVNRTMRILENQGLIQREQRTIRFPDWRALQRASGFERSYLHLKRRAS